MQTECDVTEITGIMRGLLDYPATKGYGLPVDVTGVERGASRVACLMTRNVDTPLTEP